MHIGSSSVTSKTTYIGGYQDLTLQFAGSGTRFGQYALQANRLLAMFKYLPSSVAIALSNTRPESPATALIVAESVVPEIFHADIMVAEALLASSHAPYMSIVVLVRKREKSSIIDSSPKSFICPLQLTIKH